MEKPKTPPPPGIEPSKSDLNLITSSSDFTWSNVNTTQISTYGSYPYPITQSYPSTNTMHPAYPGYASVYPIQPVQNQTNNWGTTYNYGSWYSSRLPGSTYSGNQFYLGSF